RRLDSLIAASPLLLVLSKKWPIMIASVLPLRWRNSSCSNPELFYEAHDPNCHQADGRVQRIVAGGNVACAETIYRVGVRSATALQRCRLVLVASAPAPHDPGMHRTGLAMRPRIPSAAGSEEFSVNPNAPAYVDVLQELSPLLNPMK